jgi:hypothetical protein
MSLGNFSKIMLNLTQNPKSTIDEISKITNIPKETVNRVILNLIKEKLVIENDNKYSLSQVFLNIKSNHISDVYFNFKIKPEHKQKIYYLFSKIDYYIYNAVGQKPTKTQMQKLVVQINNKLNLGLPIMWYKYGQITPVSYNPEIDYSKLIQIDIKDISEEEIYNIISDNIIEQSKIISSKEFRQKQYYSNNSEIYQLYQLKDKMLEQAYNGNFNFVEENTRKLIKLRPYFKDEYNILNNFLDFIIYFTKMYNKNENYQLKQLGIEAYNSFWEYIAIHNCLSDMKNYYIENNLNLEELSINTVFEINEIKERFEDTMDRFYEQFNLMDFIDNPETRKLLEKVMEKSKISLNG